MATDPADSTSTAAGPGPQPPATSRYRFLVSPKWIGFHLLVVTLVVVMVNLAFWQIRRLDERRHFNAEVRANSNQPVLGYSDLVGRTTQPASIEWRRVSTSGTYVTGHEFLVVNRSQNGDTGRNVVDALRLDDGTLLLVNRGFVPEATAVPPLPSGRIDVVGRLRASERRTTGQEADSGTAVLTEIRRIDIGLLAGQFGSAKVAPMYIEQLEANPADAKVLEPIVFPTLDEGPHLSYTIQWFIFSGCVIAGWVLAIRRSVAQRSGKVVKKRRSSYVPIAEDEQSLPRQ